jgi:GDPmannose 4,6-dehydratase
MELSHKISTLSSEKVRNSHLKSALVTGATGQDGSYLIELLIRQGYEVHAQSRAAIDEQAQREHVIWHFGELTDEEFLDALIADVRPAEIYNLAGISRPILTWGMPRETAEVNAFLPQTICELLLKHNAQARLFQASSSEIFGDGFSEYQDERTHCEPKSPYGVAKLYAHRIIGAYRQQYGVHACSGIMFNHESPRRSLSFVSQKIAYAAAAASLGITESKALDERGRPIISQGKLLLGDLSVRRDFGFAGDYAEAMFMILQHETPDDYVIGTGENHSVQEFCETAFGYVGLDWADYVRVDPKLIRKTDSHYTRANSKKIRTTLNWQPKMSFAQLVAIMVHEQLGNLRGELNEALQPHISLA